jgi:flavin reductase (DIM6/NTAB) family NADH-FMN oxidoreductase RutF
MSKTKIGKSNLLFPSLPVLVGTNVKGKPNYITIGMVGRLCYDTLSVSLGHNQYSNAGIRENGTFSINQPTAAMVKKLDYCGLFSGRKVDKSALFENFYGQLETAPMIKECPVNIECRVIQTIQRPVHTVFIGEINETYIDESYLTEKEWDISKIDPILLSGLPSRDGHLRGCYWRLGEYLAPAWEVGKELKP